MNQETFERKLKQLFIGNPIETIDVYQTECTHENYPRH